MKLAHSALTRHNFFPSVDICANVPILQIFCNLLITLLD